MIRRFFLLIALQVIYSFATPICAQEEVIEQSSKLLTVMKFDMLTGGVIVLKALFENNTDTLSFILDTGSGGISLDSTTIAHMGLKSGIPERMVKGIGGIRQVGFIKNKTLKINALHIDSLDFHIIDYSILSSLYGLRIDGIIGYSVLKRYILNINYDTQEISFYTNGTFKYPQGGYLLKPRIRTLPILSSQVQDERKINFNYLFDIGAGLTVLFSRDFVNDSSLLKSNRKKYLKQAEGLGGKIDMHMSVMKELKIGPYKFRNVPINIFNDEYNITSYPSLGGLIGNDIFRRFNCTLNYDKREIYLMPNTFLGTSFEYAYSGIELYLINEKALIGVIPHDSPAENAGLKEGDEVIAVNNKFGLTFNDLKQVLQSTYGKLKIIIRRNGELEKVTLNVINILKKYNK